jgi:hypothetical protein
MNARMNPFDASAASSRLRSFFFRQVLMNSLMTCELTTASGLE